MLIHQMNVVTAFLNGKLEEENYMEQLDGYICPGKEHFARKLKRGRTVKKWNPNQNTPGVKSCSERSKKGHAEKDVKLKWTAKIPYY